MKNAFVTYAAALAIVAVFGSQPLASHEVVTTTVTFDQEIARILKGKCISCHSENNLGIPFTSYEQTRPWARAIEEEVLRRHMPPWRAVSGFGQFANDIGLTNREIQFIVAWVEGKGPKTKDQQLVVNLDQGSTPEAKRLKLDFGQWQLGKPDLVKSLDAYTVDPGQEDTVRRVTMDLGLSSDRRIRALEYQPADRRVVRAVFFYLQETGQWLGSWTPWYGVTILPSPVAYRAPAGAHITAEVHYRGANQPIEDKGTLGLYWAQPAATIQATDLVLEAKPEPLSGVHWGKFYGSISVTTDVNILALKPDLPSGIDSVQITAKQPDGTLQVLLLLQDVLTEWPTPYVLKQPVMLPRSSELKLTAYFRDSALSQTPASIKLTASVFTSRPRSYPNR